MRVLLLITSLVAVASAGGVPKEMAERLMELSLLQDCWGEGNMAGYYKMVKDAADKCHLMESTVTVADLFGPRLPRVPKAEGGDDDENANDTDNAGLPDALIELLKDDDDDGDMHYTPDQLRMKMKKMEHLREGKALKVSNMSCAMREIGMWDQDEQVQMSFFRGIFEPKGLVEPIEEGFQNMNLKGYELCYTMSHAINKTEFPTPGKQRYGRQLIFHNCVLKKELNACLLKKIADVVESKFGEFDPEVAKAFGLPPNKYVASFMKMQMMPHLMPATKWFTLEVIHHGESDLYA